MGQVWEAEQEEPVRRRVALKLIRAGALSPASLARFQAERQLLAVMDHPSIARALDADATEDGRPYVVMELVPGEPITEFCARRGLGLPERLLLFRDVLAAVAHAHQKGVLHRDLKPSNLLVAEPEDRTAETGHRAGPESGVGPTRRIGAVKVIDFGIAKELEREPDVPGATRAGDLVGTPEYMSPEQAAFGSRDVDVRSDVYSLGLVLYELLTGDLPTPEVTLRERGFEAVRAWILEREAASPSAAVAERESRGESAPVASRHLRGDLDWIALCALEKDRERRYPSVAAFAEDIDRHLADEPVAAGPPTFRYRAGKFVRRHRLLVAASAVALLGLVGGLVGTTWGLFEARRSAAEAERARRTAERSSEFLADLFRGADPRERAGEDVTLEDLLVEGAERIDELEDEPGTRLFLLTTLGDVHWARGELDRAEPLLERVLAMGDAAGVLDPERFARQQVLAGARLGAIARDRAELDEAVAILRGALERGEELPETDDALGLAWNNLGTVFRRQRRLDEARDAYTRSLVIAEANEDPPGANVASVVNNLAQVASEAGEFDRAARETRRAIALFDPILPERHPARLVLQQNLGVALRNGGRLVEAQEALERAVEIGRVTFDTEHPLLADALVNLGWTLQNRGLYREAVDPLAESVAILGRTVGETSARLGSPLARVGRNALFLGDPEAGIAPLERAVETAVDPDSGYAASMAAHARDLAILLRHAGRLDEATRWIERGLERAREAEDAEAEAALLLQRALAAQETGDAEAAAREYEAALDRAGCVPDIACALDVSEGLDTRAVFHARRGDLETALARLALVLEHPQRLLWAFEHPAFDVARGSTRYVALEQRWIGIMEPDRSVESGSSAGRSRD